MDTKQKKWSKVGRIVVASTAAYNSYHGLKICQIYKVSTASSMEPLKIVSATFLLVYFVSLKESTCETRKNVFYFTLKAIFVLEIIKF